MNVIENYLDVIKKINNAKDTTGRINDQINLVAVSKTYDKDSIEPVIEAGQLVFGENRVQEASSKWPYLIGKHKNLKLHLIGPLQTNKIKDAVALFDVIETVDRPKLAEKLADELKKTDKKIECFIQINTGEEPQKAGILPKDADEFINYCINELKLPIIGLMCIPPFDEEPSAHFAFLKKIAQKHGLKNLSMGMSSDFELAIQQGATHVRVGSAIFGKRDYSNLEK